MFGSQGTKPWPYIKRSAGLGVLEAAGLAGWDLLGRRLRELLDKTLALHLEICWPGVLEAAGLAGWDLLARVLTVQGTKFWPYIKRSAGLGSSRLQAWLAGSWPGC